MGMGRGKMAAIGIGVAVLVILECASAVTARTYTVGGARGWSPMVNNWPKGKIFRAGDVLVFNYDRSLHNVVGVDRRGYSNCRTPKGAKVLRSGKDRIKLRKGHNYFICNNPGHCQNRIKIAVFAI